MRPATPCLRLAATVVTSVLVLVLLGTAAVAQDAAVVFTFRGGVGGYDVIDFSGLVADSAGNLFGTTHDGGVNNGGVAFELTRQANGWKETVLHSFGTAGDGSFLSYGLTLGPEGNVYGTTIQGGANGGGIAFQLSPASGGRWNETILHDFGNGTEDADMPIGNLIRDKSGNLYGVSSFGGKYHLGAVFELSPSDEQWSETVISSLEFDDGQPYGGLALDSRGNLYGVTLSEIFELSPASGGTWTKTVIHIFGGPGDGWGPNGNLVLDKSGNLFGTTNSGGTATTCGQNGCGTVFELSPSEGSWQETILHNFELNGIDGAQPTAGVVIGPDGTFYGTTSSGGNSTTCAIAGYSCGTVFALRNTSSGWEEKILLYFNQSGAVGYVPESVLTFGVNGDLFGTTLGGGAYTDGTVYSLKP